jgi:large subunit ribosomal protein L17
MRHLKAGRKLNRNAPHRLALMRNLTRALFEHGRIVTTVAKAKAARPFVEKLITLAKKNTLHARRLCIARLRDKVAVRKLFAEIAPRYTDRAGGYTRVLKRHERRLGDAGETAFLELLKAGERKPRKQAGPAPRVSEPPISTPVTHAPAPVPPTPVTLTPAPTPAPAPTSTDAPAPAPAPAEQQAAPPTPPQTPPAAPGT